MRIDDATGRTSREPDGNVGPFYFWLGDAFEDEADDADGTPVEYGQRPAKGAFGLDRDR